ncbi:hypothetical protein DXH95_11730 [Sphingorhabdus pulchriflava]|uniref:Anti-sigma factor n=1 Tax=Sphingorhabdus pulchriflava TaxID=2292257 RepID=A0A371B5A4_9SPHN|nr:hypothetical protein [Sphingorhabdus pulchriflava]RDV02623.1 hypothetical protein DXH95_11730 [Sphingorhabdus pulchriflava]
MADRAETIAAYLDGNLTGEARARFEAEMRDDAALAAEVHQWQASDAMVRAAFPLSEDGIDAALLERLGLGTVEGEAKALPVAANDNRWSWGRIGLVGGALAASLAIAMVLFQPEAGGFADDQQFQIAMEKLPSGQTRELASGDTVGPVLTFRAGDGRFCREFSGENTGGGIACRSGGKWTIEAQAKYGAVVGNGSEIGTAAGSEPAALDTAMERLKASDPLNGDKEKIAISLGWIQ